VTKRKISKLYRAASAAYRDGALAAVAENHLRRRDGDPLAYCERDAVHLAYTAGHQAGAAVADDLPTEVWSMVLAEAMRP
jgi:hypothetical protein